MLTSISQEPTLSATPYSDLKEFLGIYLHVFTFFNSV
jgi:hypothetical protein